MFKSQLQNSKNCFLRLFCQLIFPFLGLLSQVCPAKWEKNLSKKCIKNQCFIILQLALKIILALFSLLYVHLNALSTIEIKRKIDSYASGFLKTNPASGIIIGIIRPDPEVPGQFLTEISSSGMMSFKDKRSIDERTLFRIGSITKVFTAALLAHYIESTEMKLSDPAQKFLPTDVHMPTYNTRPITLLDLATHTSGLPFMPSNFYRNRPYSVNDMYDYLNRCRLLSPPGRKFKYSNLGYAVLSTILVRSGRETWQHLLEVEICDKLKMYDTRVELNEEQKHRLAIGSRKNGDSITLHSPFIGSGGLFSSMGDMLKWLSYHLEIESTELNFLLPIVLEPRKVIQSSRNQGEMCLGWEYAFLDKSRDLHCYFSEGRFGGYSAFIAFVKSERNGVVVLTNGEYPCESLGIKILKDLNEE